MSEDPLFSEHWHRVRVLRPVLGADVRVVRHLYRGRSSHLLHRPSKNAYHRLDSLAWDVVARFDGTRRVEDVWRDARGTHGDAAPTQPELVQLLTTLHEADLLVVDRTLDAERLFRRGRDEASRERRQRLANPLYLRFALGDPGRWVERLTPVTKWLFTRGAAVAWLALVLAAIVRVVPEWPSLAAEIAAVDVRSPARLALFGTVYVLIKLVHEFAHALTVHHHGGRVRECGIALMVLLPNPYTDAGAATLFPDKRHRMQVGAAGIVAELGLAAGAALVWVASDGLVREVALATMLIGGLSTLLFNGNPLLRFDGYHVLADGLEIPNLADRARRRLLALSARHLLGLPDVGGDGARAAAEDRRERLWLVAYGVASALYRVALMLGIAWLLSGRYFLFGALLAGYVVYTLFAVPTYRLVRFVHALPPGARGRGALGTALPSVALALFVALVPLPRASVADGVVWLPERAVLRAAHRCEIVETFVEPGTRVIAGTPLLRCEDADLAAERRRIAARVRELAAERSGLATRDPVAHAALGRELSDARSALALVVRRLDAQQVRSETDGRFTIEGRETLLGRYVEQGAILAWIVPTRSRTVRVALTQDEIGRVEHAVERVDVALLQHPGADGRFTSRIVRRTPKPGTVVLDASLTREGGGRLAAERGAAGLRFLEPVFDVELAWPETAPDSRVGGAARVRFVHEPSPLLTRLASGARRALMGRAFE